MSPMRAGLLATLSGITNVVSRASGGFASDTACRMLGMKGRILVHFFLVFAPGLLLLWFAATQQEVMATTALVSLSYLAQVHKHTHLHHTTGYYTQLAPRSRTPFSQLNIKN
jgi:nitrate/nitrite transporter NarK